MLAFAEQLQLILLTVILLGVSLHIYRSVCRSLKEQSQDYRDDQSLPKSEMRRRGESAICDCTSQNREEM